MMIVMIMMMMMIMMMLMSRILLNIKKVVFVFGEGMCKKDITIQLLIVVKHLYILFIRQEFEIFDSPVGGDDQMGRQGWGRPGNGSHGDDDDNDHDGDYNVLYSSITYMYHIYPFSFLVSHNCSRWVSRSLAA